MGTGPTGSADARQGPFVTIKDLAVVRPGTVVPEGVTLAPMTVWEGNPGKLKSITVILDIGSSHVC